MVETGSEAVHCPNCSTEVTYASLNGHLDKCLGLDERKRPAPAQPGAVAGEDERGAKRSRLMDKLPKDAPPPLASSRPATATTSRERLDSVAPLAERLRPRSLDDFVGQEAVVNGPLRALLQRGGIPNAILWGPPGTGERRQRGVGVKGEHTAETLAHHQARRHWHASSHALPTTRLARIVSSRSRRRLHRRTMSKRSSTRPSVGCS